MIAGPVLAGSDQPTVRLVSEEAVAVGASGTEGGSSRSVTFTVMATLSDRPPSLACTVKEYSVFASKFNVVPLASVSTPWPSAFPVIVNEA